MYQEYSLTLFGLWVILATVIIQSFVASVAHRRQSSYVPGVLDENLGHDSFVFRSHRTLQNSLENVFLMVASIIIAIMLGISTFWLALLVWLFAFARVMHMLLYYLIATEKNPSPRSYFYGLGMLCNIALMAMLGIHFI